MAQVKSTTKQDTQKIAKGASAGFSDEEKAAMKTRALEMKAAARADKDRSEGEKAVQAAIAAMSEPDRGMASRLHEIIAASAPDLWPKTWYGMPAYARDGKVVCFYQAAQKFGTRYATLGFSDVANLDQDAMWPVTYALKQVTAVEEARIIALVKQAVS